MFDEDTGLPIEKRGGKSGYEKRRGRVRCESRGAVCPKGHWKDKPDLTPNQRAVIDLYNATQAMNGLNLNEAERRDYFLNTVFGKLYEVEKAFKERQNTELVQLMMTVASRSK